MKAPVKLPFWLSATVLVTVLLLLTLSGWGVPLKWIATGEIFRRKFTYVWSGIGDSFNAGVGKMVVVSVILFAVFAGVVGVLKWFTARLNRIEKGVFRILIVLLGLFPLSAAATAFVMVVRLTLDMGTTPNRLMGLGCTAGGIMVISGCLWLFLRFQRRPGAEQHPGGGKRTRGEMIATNNKAEAG
jgi:hypothetical protein